MSDAAQRRTLDLIGKLNARHLAARGDDSELVARIQAYELAYRMQSAAPEAVDLSRETDETRRLYGLDRPETAEFGTRCLLARRLVERGVRFVQLYSGDVNGWDAHDDVEANHARMCARTDQPIAGLLEGPEAARAARGDAGHLGRRVRPDADVRRAAGAATTTRTASRSGWPAAASRGARSTAPPTRSASAPRSTRVHVHDLHATILHLLGLDHTRLTFPHNGRDDRLTDTAGKVVQAILA